MDKEEKHFNKCPICGRPTHKESEYCIFHASAEEKIEKEFKEALKEYVKKIKKEDGDYDFKKFIFIGDIDFKEDLNIEFFKNIDLGRTTFEGNANFNGVIFYGIANFSEATFERTTYFSKVTFKGSVDFSEAKFDGNVHFNGLIFKVDANFSEAIFNGHVSFIKATFENDVDFISSAFKNDADFISSTFKRVARFIGVTFEGVTDFDRSTFKRVADFNGAIFNGNANFVSATFTGNADFKGTTFEAGAYFTWGTFNGPAFFSNSTFKAGANFAGATFNEHAFFSEATFKTGATFTGATFKKHAYFTFTTFNGHATFDKVNFKGDVSFDLQKLLTYLNLNETKVLPGKKLTINVNNGKENIFFQRAYLENACLNLELCEDVFIDLTDTLLKNTKIKKDQIKSHILQEKEKKFSEAQEIFLLLKNNFHSIGRYDDESWAFIKEKDMDRFRNSFGEIVNSHRKKSQFKKILLNIKKSPIKRIIVKFRLFKKWLFSKKAIKRFNLSVSNYIFQYGENPWYVIRFASIVILIFAVLLNISGIIKGDRTDLILQQIKEMQGGNVLKYSGPIIGNFLNCLYFSVVTFTTLGYGDFQPLEGWSRFLVSSEALLGAFTMALFVYTFARRTGGR